jgi:hypothetical protein
MSFLYKSHSSFIACCAVSRAFLFLRPHLLRVCRPRCQAHIQSFHSKTKRHSLSLSLAASRDVQRGCCHIVSSSIPTSASIHRLSLPSPTSAAASYPIHRSGFTAICRSLYAILKPNGRPDRSPRCRTWLQRATGNLDSRTSPPPLGPPFEPPSKRHAPKHCSARGDFEPC